MKVILTLLLLLTPLLAQQTASTATPPNLQATLAQVDETAHRAAVEIAQLRIEKWKTESQQKHLAQSHADSVQRNVSSALPTLVSNARNAPQDLAAVFKLYRNLVALYDVMTSLTESAGAFGSKQDFESLEQYTASIDQQRRSLGDYFETLAAAKDAEIVQLRTAAKTAPAAAVKPKKVIVDNEPDKPVKKPKKKTTPPPPPPAPSTPN